MKKFIKYIIIAIFPVLFVVVFLFGALPLLLYNLENLDPQNVQIFFDHLAKKIDHPATIFDHW